MSTPRRSSMKDRLVPWLLAAMLVATVAGPADARRAKRAKPRVTPPSRPGAVAAPRDSGDGTALRLARAAAEQRAGQLRGVIEQLEPLDFAAPRFAGADRAAFLLGHAYLALGDRA